MRIVALGPGVSDSFWPTVAQVVPVLALALIIEARTTITHWDKRFPWPLRSIQGFSWAYVLIQSAIVEIVAFNDLAGNEKSGAWVTFAKGAIFSSLVILVLTPALSILGRANTGALARLIVHAIALPNSRQRLRLLYRIKRTEYRLVKRRQKLQALLERAQAAEQRHMSGTDVDSPENQEYLAEARSIAEDISRDISTVEDDLHKLAEIKTERGKLWDELVEIRKKFYEQMEDLSADDDSPNAHDPSGTDHQS